jgi:hypothetical protein
MNKYTVKVQIAQPVEKDKGESVEYSLTEYGKARMYLFKMIDQFTIEHLEILKKNLCLSSYLPYFNLPIIHIHIKIFKYVLMLISYRRY